MSREETEEAESGRRETEKDNDKREEETARDKWAAARQVWLAERTRRRPLVRNKVKESKRNKRTPVSPPPPPPPLPPSVRLEASILQRRIVAVIRIHYEPAAAAALMRLFINVS